MAGGITEKRQIAAGIALASFLLFMSSLNIYCQPLKTRKADQKSGYVKFYWDLTSRLKYPKEAEVKNAIGMSVTKISLDQEGKLTAAETVNSIEKSIDLAVIVALNKISLKFLLSDSSNTNRTFYIQVAFILEGGPDDFFFKSAWPEKKIFVRPVAIYGFPLREGRFLFPKSDNSLSMECTDQYNAGNYDIALRLADEMIKRYPYTKQLYQLRILIARRLNNSDIIERDAMKISNFADSLSLDRLLFEY